jgi:nitrate/nitrite transporter NarK
VVSSLGFSTTITLVLTAPPSLVAGVVGIAIGISSGKYNDRTWHITAMMAIAVVGFTISAVTLNVAARYVSCFLFASGESNCPVGITAANSDDQVSTRSIQ